jgi:hypothetical protein
MSRGVQPKGERVRNFLIQSIIEKRTDVVNATAERFRISRQGVHQHIDRLRGQGAIAIGGTRRKPQYSLVPIAASKKMIQLLPGLAEDEVWESSVKPMISMLPANVLGIWNHAFTEMFNNAIDHSGGTHTYLQITRTALSTEIWITDDGVGIFKKIRQEFDLDDERHAIFELSKGKLTTDPKNHSGEGIFFSSRMLDLFVIISGDLLFSHNHNHANDWLFDDINAGTGTSVKMALNNHSSRTTRKIFDQYSGDDGDYGFNKTVIPVNLASYGADGLVSRSQAKRVLARVNQFERVVFDFDGVQEIGQAFADQIFRVYAREHPEIEMTCINTIPAVQQMIRRAQSNEIDETADKHE